MAIEVAPLSKDLTFGARITGLTREMTSDPAVRSTINEVFERDGMILFEDVEPTNQMQVAVSDIFGPLKEHPVPSIARVDADAMPGVIKLHSGGENGGIVELDGELLSHWLPWHFDHCYNDELNRAGILRSAMVSSRGGITGFLDGIALYDAFPMDLLARIEDAEIVYTLNTHYHTQRFGQPDNVKIVRPKPMGKDFESQANAMPRAIHPAVWTRRSGEKVMHVSPYMAEGILGEENEQGDALLEEVSQTINRLAPGISYHHKWRPSDMLIWDNWRMLHSVSGHHPDEERIMYRTTIKGDYGLGRFDVKCKDGSLLEEAAG